MHDEMIRRLVAVRDDVRNCSALTSEGHGATLREVRLLIPPGEDDLACQLVDLESWIVEGGSGYPEDIEMLDRAIALLSGGGAP